MGQWLQNGSPALVYRFVGVFASLLNGFHEIFDGHGRARQNVLVGGAALLVQPQGAYLIGGAAAQPAAEGVGLPVPAATNIFYIF